MARQSTDETHVVTGPSPASSSIVCDGYRPRDVLVACEVAFCTTLLIGAGLLVRGSVRALDIDPGFETKKALGMGIGMPPGLGYDSARSAAIVRELTARFRTVPGVQSVARGRIPLAGNLREASVLSSGSGKASRALSASYYSYVSPEYFEALGIPIVRGRGFTEPDGEAAAVTIVSASAARALWPDEDPLGKHVTLDASTRFHDAEGLYPAGQSREVVGVAADLRSAWLNAGLFVTSPSTVWA